MSGYTQMGHFCPNCGGKDGDHTMSCPHAKWPTQDMVISETTNLQNKLALALKENEELRQELAECHRAIAIFCREETEFSFAGDKPAIEWFIGEYSEDNFEGNHP